MGQRLFNVGQETLLVSDNDICTNAATMVVHAYSTCAKCLEFQEQSHKFRPWRKYAYHLIQ